MSNVVAELNKVLWSLPKYIFDQYFLSVHKGSVQVNAGFILLIFSIILQFKYRFCLSSRYKITSLVIFNII